MDLLKMKMSLALMLVLMMVSALLLVAMPSAIGISGQQQPQQGLQYQGDQDEGASSIHDNTLTSLTRLPVPSYGSPVPTYSSPRPTRYWPSLVPSYAPPASSPVPSYPSIWPSPVPSYVPSPQPPGYLSTPKPTSYILSPKPTMMATRKTTYKPTTTGGYPIATYNPTLQRHVTRR